MLRTNENRQLKLVMSSVATAPVLHSVAIDLHLVARRPVLPEALQFVLFAFAVVFAEQCPALAPVGFVACWEC